VNPGAQYETDAKIELSKEDERKQRDKIASRISQENVGRFKTKVEKNECWYKFMAPS
jgi:hypothetical protein